MRPLRPPAAADRSLFVAAQIVRENGRSLPNRTLTLSLSLPLFQQLGRSRGTCHLARLVAHVSGTWQRTWHVLPRGNHSSTRARGPPRLNTVQSDICRRPGQLAFAGLAAAQSQAQLSIPRVWISVVDFDRLL